MNSKQLATKYLIILLLLLWNTSNFNAYSQCSTDMSDFFPYVSDVANDLKVTPKLNNVNLGLSIFVTKDSLGNAIIESSEINTAISELNDAFEPTGIEFYFFALTQIDDYNYSTLTNYQDINDLPILYSSANYINIYIVDKLLINGSGVQNDSVNAYIPYADPTIENDFIFITKKALLSSEFVHQIGHIFGLLHTYERGLGAEYVNGSNCNSSGDYICDTPADGVGNDPNGVNFVPHKSNYMTYESNSRCRFSLGQIHYMKHIYKNYKTYLR